MDDESGEPAEKDTYQVQEEVDESRDCEADGKVE